MGERAVSAAFFKPTSVAVIGASEEPGRIGSGLYKSITLDFRGPVYCVNPRHETLWGRRCYESAAALPAGISHAVIAVGRRLVPDCLRQCAEKGIENIVVISSGFKELDAEGAQMEREMAAFCRQRGIRLLGPNTLGFLNTAANFNGTFLPASIPPGRVSVISQSGGVGMALLSALRDQRCGVAKWVGIGNEAVLDAVAFLKFFAEDAETDAIAVCFEGLRDLGGFLRLAAEVNRKKPVVLLRDGKSAIGMQAAASHTGTMAQDGAVMDGLIRQFGLLEAGSCRECAVVLKALTTAKAPAGCRAAILTNTAGPSILAADGMEPRGVCLPQPSKALQESIDREAGVAMGLKNPADISSNGLTPKNYGVAARRLLGSEEYDILLGFFSLNPHLILPEQELMDAARQAGKPAVACFLTSCEEFSQYNLAIEAAGIPCYCDPQDAAFAVAALVQRGKALRRESVPAGPDLTPQQVQDVEALLKTLPQSGTLSERQAKALLHRAGVALQVPAAVDSAREAARAAAAMGYPVALKLESSRITHKSDAGGVRLQLENEQALIAAYEEMLPPLRSLDPEAKLTVQPMAKSGFELIVGAVRAPRVGALLMVGMGGVYSEVLHDTAFCLLPMAGDEPARMLSKLRCAPILQGFRGAALDCGAVETLMHRLAALMARFPQIAELEMNPCRVYEHDLAVLDARVVLRAPADDEI